MSRKGKQSNKRKWNLYYYVLDKKKSAIDTVIWIIGTILMLGNVVLYSLTIINYYFFLTAFIVVGIIITILTWERFGKTYAFSGAKKVFISLFISLLGWSSILLFSFLSTNYYLSDKELKQEKYTIVKWSSIKGKRRQKSKRVPIFTIILEGEKKEVAFAHEYYEHREAYKKLKLDTKKGFWGYTVIKKKELVIN